MPNRSPAVSPPRAEVTASDTGLTRRPLKFGQGNAKLSPAITTFSLVAGHSCPFARDCLSRADRSSGYIRDGRHVRYRCYAATMEARRPSIRRARWHNFTLLKACRSAEEMNHPDRTMTSYYPTDLTEARRRSIFADLVGAQDEGLDVPRSRELVTSQHGVALDEVKEVEREGIDHQWPPLG